MANPLRTIWQRRTRSALWIGVALLAALLCWRFLGGDGVDRSIVYTIDYGNDVPFHFKGPDGAPTGLAVDLVREAARAKNIRLDWASEGGGRAGPHPLRVLISVRTNLLKDLHLTEPYLQGRSSFIVASNSPIWTVSQLEGKKISYVNYAIHRANLAKVLTNYLPVPTANSREALEKVTTGQADAVLLSDYAVEPTCLSIPLPFPLRIFPSHAPVSNMAIASLHEYARVADVLRDGIREMAVDGRLERIVDQWGFFPNLTTDHRDELIKEQRKVRYLQVAIGFLILMVGLSGWLIARLRTEKLLARAAEHTRAATLDALPAHIALLDAAGVIVAVNQSWCNFGDDNALQNSAYCLGQNYLELCERADGDCSGEALIAAGGIRRVLRGEAREFALEYPCHSPSAQRWFRLMVTPVSELNRNGAVVMHINITERKLGELALKASELKSRSIVDSIPVPMALNDDHQRIIYLNPAFVKAFGYTQEDIPTLNDWWPKAYPDPVYRQWVLESWSAELNRARQSVTAFQPLELRVNAKDGTSRVVLAAASLFQGSTQGEHLVVLIDITERKQGELERTHLREQLLQAQKMEVVGHLAGGVAHDFNNLLAAMMLHFGSLAEDEQLSPEIRKDMTELVNSAQQASGITRQLLMFSRRQIVQQKILHLEPVIGKLLNMLRRLIGENILLKFDCQHPDRPVMADESMMEQIILNLVVNARDAMPGGGLITITTQPVSSNGAGSNLPSGDFMRIQVQDTGCGMDAATQARIFEPFFTTKEPGKGTGLGLATVFGIVKQHDGHIQVQSEPFKGTIFTVCIPVFHSPPSVVTGASERTKPVGGGETVLLVEDEVTVRKFLALMLKRKGYTVLEAGNARDAASLWRQHRTEVRLLLSDMMLEGNVNGLELTKELLAHKPSLRVVLMSGYSMELLGADLSFSNSIRFMSKPFTNDEILRTIRESLDASP